MFAMSDAQFGLVYNILSFSLASMMSTTLFLWMRVPAVKNQYQSALIISGMVTFIAAYHYLRIFNSWVDWCSIQRCLPLHGLALDSATSAHRDRLRDEAPRRSDQEQIYCPWCVFRLDDLHWLPRRVARRGQLGRPLVLLGRSPLPIPLRCLRVACRYGRSHKQRDRPSDQANDPALPVLDRRQLVDLPSCLHLPNDRLQWLPRSCGHPGGLLHLRHHLQVRRRPCHLWCHSGQV